MNRFQLEHVLRACAAIVDDDEFVVIGSQSILGAHPNAPGDLLRSMDLDLYPRNAPDQSIEIDGAIGEGSLFHQTFGYYPHAVGPETAILPEGWQGRLVRVASKNTDGAVGWCLEPADLAVSKLAAGRESDYEFVERMLHHHLVTIDTILERLDQTSLHPVVRENAIAFLKRQRD